MDAGEGRGGGRRDSPENGDGFDVEDGREPGTRLQKRLYVFSRKHKKRVYTRLGELSSRSPPSGGSQG